MKKILLGLVMLVAAATMNAQIKLEHVFEGSNCYTKYEFTSYGVDDLIFIWGNDYKLYVYNADFSFYGAYDADSRIVARNIFTIDNKICFVKTESNDRKITIFDENNKIVNELKLDERLTELEYCVAKIGNQYKFMITGWIDDNPNNQVTYIYSCPGNGEATTSVENVPAKVKRNAYPNPATDLVTLPYDANGATSMKIYDMQGKLVERKFLDKSKQELQLNVKDYPSGMYFFEVNGESNSFIVD